MDPVEIDSKCSTGAAGHHLCKETSCYWEDKSVTGTDFFDDGTMTFFWRAHRLTVLIIFTLVLVYVSLWESVNYDTDYNTKRGIFAVIFAFVLFGVTNMPDGPFHRPHPAFWRLMLVLSIVYELFLVFLLFQTADDSRQLMRHFDSDLGRALPEKDYGGNCRIYDYEKPEDPLHNFWDKMDGFVVVHFVGWWLKTLILRDWWMCMVMSIMFEVLEYTLEHQLPNFSECWWDHWIMDVVVCNGLGIYLGMKTLNYLSMKPYHWRGMWNIATYRGKLSRVLSQFTPYDWIEFDWRPTSSLKRWISLLVITFLFLIAELNTFSLKFVLWIPPPHFLCLGRLTFLLFWGAVSMREVYQFLDDPLCKKIGTQTWMLLAIIVTEVLITLKFDWETFTKPFPRHVIIGWAIGLAGLVSWSVWHFYLQRLLGYSEQRSNGHARSNVDGNGHQNNNSSKDIAPTKLKDDDIRLRRKKPVASSSKQ